MKRTLRLENKYKYNLSRKRFENELRRRTRKYGSYKTSSASHLFQSKVIKVPEIVSIYSVEVGKPDNYSYTCDLVNEISKYLVSQNCVFDFTDTKNITAAASVVVYAAIDNAISKGGFKAEILWSNTPRVNTHLRRNKFHHLMSHQEYRYDFHTSKTLPVISGFGGQYTDEIVDFIQRRAYLNEMTAEAEWAYGDAVSETIHNVGLHAYPSKSKEERKWWLLCEVVGKELYLAIYDAGVGIPNTVVEKPWIWSSASSIYPELIKDLEEQFPDLKGSNFLTMRKLSDEKLIYLSMEGDVSGTKKSKHGQGSKSIKKLVSETDQGKLWVYSRNGLCIFEDEDLVPTVSRLPKPLPGTLIQWNIKLS